MAQVLRGMVYAVNRGVAAAILGLALWLRERYDEC